MFRVLAEFDSNLLASVKRAVLRGASTPRVGASMWRILLRSHSLRHRFVDSTLERLEQDVVRSIVANLPGVVLTTCLVAEVDDGLIAGGRNRARSSGFR